MVDLSVFQKLKTPQDFQRVNDEFKARKEDRALQKLMLREKVKNMGKRNYEEIAADAMFKHFKGGKLSPDEMAAINVLSAKTGDKTKYSRDALGNLVPETTPNQYSQFLNRIGGQTSMPSAPQSYVQPDINEIQGADPFADSYQEMSGNELPPIPQGVNPMVANSPQGLLESYKSRLSMNEKENDPMVAIQREKLQMQQEKQDRELEEAENQKQQRQSAKEETAQTVTQDLKRAISILNSGGIMPKAGTVGEFLSPIGETPSGQIADLVKTVKANIGFDKLQAMREASPTGGALGQVSEMENRLLQATQGNLEIGQKTGQLDQNLKRIYNKYMDTIHGTPDEIRTIAQQKGLDPNLVQSLSFRYPLNFNEFGDRVDSQEDIQDLLKYMTPEDRALFQ